jgi:hypothetical protein
MRGEGTILCDVSFLARNTNPRLHKIPTSWTDATERVPGTTGT